ncbi:MAG TPA: YggT family protein [Acidimicrobiia bacterium]|nr:YggT family protein [Acidimicrobiia bacterium]
MGILCFIVQAYSLVVFARIVLEWIPVSYDHPLARVRAAFRTFTEPVLRPLRAILPPVRMGAMALDLSPLVLLIALGILAAAIC